MRQADIARIILANWEYYVSTPWSKDMNTKPLENVRQIVYSWYGQTMDAHGLMMEVDYIRNGLAFVLNDKEFDGERHIEIIRSMYDELVERMRQNILDWKIFIVEHEAKKKHCPLCDSTNLSTYTCLRCGNDL